MDVVAPLIAVTGRRRSAAGVHSGPSALDALVIDAYFTGYAEHVAAAGGIAVHVPSATPPSVLDRCDGLVLTGGSDVDPALFGAEPAPTTSPLDPARDRFELALLDAALQRELPVLAICRGLQLLNVARGGTLHAHLDEHASSAQHEVTTGADSALRRLYGPRTAVNSLHHQGVDRLGRDLVVTAQAPDGVVEGVELPGDRGPRVVAVQWHPEQLGVERDADGASTVPAPAPVFAWLVEAARATAHRGRHQSGSDAGADDVGNSTARCSAV